MRVLVVGAGIAGLSAALRLRQVGMEPTVVERSRAERGRGYMVDFFGPGIPAAERLGLHEEMSAIHDPVHHLAFVDAAGRPRFAVDYPAVRRRLFRGRHFNFPPGRPGAAPPPSRQRRDRRPVRPARRRGLPAEADRQPVRVRSDDGATEEWPVAIAADGVHSAVRRSLLAADEWAVHDLGHTVAARTFDGLLPGYERTTPSPSARPAGWSLADELAAGAEDVPAALDRYEARMRPVVRRLANSGARTAAWFVPEQRWRIPVRDLAVRASAWPVVGTAVGTRLGAGRAAAQPLRPLRGSTTAACPRAQHRQGAAKARLS